MKRSTDRILTTHTGSLPRTAKVVELLLAEQKNPGARKAELNAAVREAIAHVVQKQIECGIDIINDGEQGRTDYTVHVLDRLSGFAGESTPPLGTGDVEFPIAPTSRCCATLSTSTKALPASARLSR